MHDELVGAGLQMLLGDEAVALAAIDSGISAAYAYPGTPSTEILETLELRGDKPARWCANEKTAYEQALGMSMTGKRALVSMKHVGLNVAADPFMNSAVVRPIGGLVLAVADDPGMHSSQNEQDSRFYADFARVPCLEPADPQQCYDMTLEAFEISERFRTPVVLRLVTRIAHQRAIVRAGTRRAENPLADADRSEWVLLPGFARRNWRKRIEGRKEIENWSESSRFNTLTLNASFRELGVITTGMAGAYFDEVTAVLGLTPSHVHIGAYPIPASMIRELADHVSEVLVIEEGYAYVERLLRGIIPPLVPIRGKDSGEVPADGELSTEIVAKALGVELPRGMAVPIDLPERPPRLCDGCPHIDAYNALTTALGAYEKPLVTSDIGCYTLGALPPLNIGQSCVCMGASIGMAKGAAEAGRHPVVAVIGDSTFLHSGVTPLMDAVAGNANMTLVILDNDTVAMTGTQQTLLPSSRIVDIVRAVGVQPEHCHVFESHPRRVGELADLLREEIAYGGLSVVIVHRECIEAARRNRKARTS